MNRIATAADAAMDACVAPGYTRAGLAVRSRTLPEFTAAGKPSAAGATVLITGATSGIGRAAAVALARAGARVHFLARDPARAERARRGIEAAAGGGPVSYGLADLEDLGSVRRFAREFLAANDRLDVLIHNAGAIHPEFRAAADGTELTLLGQVVAPFLLTGLLLPALEASAGRVITVSSGGMYTQRLDLANLWAGPDGYRGAVAYARAKRAQVALSAEWARRLAGSPVGFHAMHPGWVDTPGLATALPGFHRITRRALRTPEEGADTAVWLATAPAGRLGSGRFWHDRRPRPEHRLPWTRGDDAQAAHLLWDWLAAVTGLQSPRLEGAARRP